MVRIPSGGVPWLLRLRGIRENHARHGGVGGGRGRRLVGGIARGHFKNLGFDPKSKGSH